MPAELYEEPLELKVGILEAVLPHSKQYLATAYPFPSLEITGRAEARTFRSLVLENSYLRATVVPALGGRLLRLFDKRSSTEVLPVREVLTLTKGGPRGAILPDGLQIRLEEGRDRLNSLGPVTVQAVEAEDEGSPAQLWIGEVAGPISFNACYTLHPDRAELLLEVRAYNRTFGWHDYNGGVAGDCRLLGVTGVDTFLGFQDEHGARRFEEQFPFLLTPRQSDSFTLALSPMKEGGRAFREGHVHWGPESLTLQAVEQRLNHKLVVLTQDGQSLEAKVDLYPERPYELPFASLPSPPAAIALLDPAKNEVLRSDRDEPARVLPHSVPDPAYEASLLQMMSDNELRVSVAIPERRGGAAALLGYRSTARGDWQQAHRWFETSLLYNADDPLTWWGQALVARLAGDEAEERPELLNAHYLAPLEPALRAESFLSQTEPQGKEPNPILRPLEEAPEQFVDVACHLLDMGLFAEATRWIDEALRHHDLSMLHYLQAYALLEKTRMSVEASEHVRAAAASPLRPPFPWRAVERKALEVVVAAFPQDARAAQFLRLAPSRIIGEC